MKKNFLSEFHEHHSEALEKEVAEMSKHPCSFEQVQQQVEQIHKESCRKERQDA